MSGPILLTGGNGMVGHSVLDLAMRRNIAILAPPRRELDLLDAAAVAAYVDRVKPSFIIHAAGRVGGIQANMREPVAFLTENWDMGRNVVLAARAAGVTRLVNLGSSCMYPKDLDHPLREEDLLTAPLEPTNEGYAIAKCSVAKLCDYIRFETPKFQFKTLIPCNLYGPYDTFDPTRSHLAPAVIHKLHQAKATGQTSVEIWGDGTARREFLYVGDLADAVLAALDRFDTLPPLMNVGVGADNTINEYYQIAAEVIGYRGGFRHDLTKPVGMKRKVVDVSRAKTWGWSAATSTRDGLAATYNYYVTSGLAESFAAP